MLTFLLLLSVCSYKTIVVLSVKRGETTTVSMSSKYKLPVSLSARGSDMIRKFYTQVSKIVALIITLVGTTNWESS